MSTAARLQRIADRLAAVEADNPAADLAIHRALSRPGFPPPYITSEQAADMLLPPGFEWRPGTYLGRLIYGMCRRIGLDGEFPPYPHHGQFAQTKP